VLLVGGILASVLMGASGATALELGEQAPDFALPSTMGGKVSLSQFRGQSLVLIEFYTNDFVPT
jgi:peroxiredoxin